MSYRRYNPTVVATAPLVEADSVLVPSEEMGVPQKKGLTTWIAYPLAILLSPGLSALLYSFVPDIMGAPLAAVSRSLNEPWQIGGLLAWRLVEITLGFVFGLDREWLLVTRAKHKTTLERPLTSTCRL
jgi:hypothetical protein